MYLTLEVISANAASLGGGRRKVFSVDGGRIGRAAENDMMLPGAGVHRHHATVRFINGVFFIEGVGTNGIAINDPDRVLPRNEPYPLKSGDKVFIDEFELAVTASAGPPAESAGGAQTTLRSASPAAEPMGYAARPAAPPLIADPMLEAEDLDPLRQLNARGAASSPPPRQPEPAWNHSSSLNDHFAPAPPAAPSSHAQAIPEDWDKTSFKLQPKNPPEAPAAHASAPYAGQPSPARPATPHPAQPSPHSYAARPEHSPATRPPAGAAGAGSFASSFDWDAFLRSAGVDPATVPGDTSAVLGNIMRSVVQGLIEVLRARSEIKTEFRLPVTQVKVSENNPLKFAANAEDALINLFGRRNAAYLPPQEAFEDAFNDVRFHQLAMLVGVRAGFDHLMSRFDPEQLEQSFAKHGRRGLFGGSTKYWEMYAERFQEMAADRDETFRRLFGEEFARAYEQQLAQLKRARAQR
jgi:type VI secretion system protein ImpI